ncbi:MAG: hypothetical protein QM564_12020 [Bergeyella sp.]
MKLQIKIQMIVAILGFISISGQTIKKLNDPSIVAHYKRNTYEAWGDWRPYPKYTLGIQTNFAYATIWGTWAPARNKRYKNGEDIRPLKPTGLEVQRLTLAELQKKETENILIQTDTLQKRSLQDFAHWTSATVDADPLWLLYYKRMLKPLKEFPENPQNYLEWQLPNDEVYQTMIAHGGLRALQERLDILKDKYYKSRTMDMPRGKRFLMYHEILKEWRAFDNKLKSYSNKNTLFMEYKKMLAIVKNQKENFTNVVNIKENDVKIVKDIMNKYKHQF